MIGKIGYSIFSLVLLIGSFFGPFFVWSHFDLHAKYTPENWLDLPIIILTFVWWVGGCWVGLALTMGSLDEWMDKS